jgi:hypothetical protein
MDRSKGPALHRGERDELCAMLTALGMPGERVDALTARTSAAVVATNP